MKVIPVYSNYLSCQRKNILYLADFTKDKSFFDQTKKAAVQKFYPEYEIHMNFKDL